MLTSSELAVGDICHQRVARTADAIPSSYSPFSESEELPYRVLTSAQASGGLSHGPSNPHNKTADRHAVSSNYFVEWPGPVAAGFGGHGNRNRDIAMPRTFNRDGLGVNVNTDCELTLTSVLFYTLQS